MLPIQRAYDKYRRDGFLQLCLRGTEMMYERLSAPLWKLLWHLPPRRMTLSAGDTSATFLRSFQKAHSHDFTDDFKEEETILEAFVAELRTADLVWDVGANLGIYSCLALQIVTEGEVHAFEPEPTTAEQCARHLELNGSNGNVHQFALHDTSETIHLHIRGQTGHSMMSDGDTTTVTAEALPGDIALCRYDLPAPNVLKIDVEGMEMAVLKGMVQIFDTSPPRVIFVEIHPNRLESIGYSDTDVINFLIDRGYTLTEYQKSISRGQYNLKAVR